MSYAENCFRYGILKLLRMQTHVLRGYLRAKNMT